MPPGTIYVGRGSKYGNRFTVALYGRAEAVRLFEEWILIFFDDEVKTLRGKNVACWCREDEPYCHGDVILRLANR